MGDAIPAASPSRSHRGKLRKSADPVDAGGDAKMGEAAAASGSSGRYAALADVFDDTSSEGAEKRKDDKDPSDMEESDDTEDDDEDDSDDDSDEVEIVEPAKVSKSDPPADDDLLDSEEEEDDDIDLDEHEDPSDRDIAWSPEFRRLMQHNNRCVACGSGEHADVRSAACPLFRTKIDQAMVERKLPSTDIRFGGVSLLSFDQAAHRAVGPPQRDPTGLLGRSETPPARRRSFCLEECVSTHLAIEQ